MEQFEMWWNINHPTYDTGNDTVGVYNQNKAGWIAALKWAYQESLDNYDDSDFRFILEQECPELTGDDMPWN